MSYCKKIKVRLAVVEDYERVLLLVKRVHEESYFSDVSFSIKKYDELFYRAITEPQLCVCLVAERRGELLGFIYATLGEYFIGDGTYIASVQVIYSKPEVRGSLSGGKVALRLIKATEQWAKSRKAVAVMFHITSGMRLKQSDKVFRRLGMKTLGGNYLKSIGGD